MKKTKLIMMLICLCIMCVTFSLFNLLGKNKESKASKISSKELSINQATNKLKTTNSKLKEFDNNFSSEEKLLIDLTDDVQLEKVLLNPNIQSHVKKCIKQKKLMALLH